MTKEFCDQCGELISDYRYSAGDSISVRRTNSQAWWFVEIKVTCPSDRNSWKLCTYCCDEVIDQAYKQICDERVKREEQWLKNTSKHD